MLHGWIILDKPIGLGSTQAVAAVKRNLRVAGEPKTKVGHGGTLDPLATGVLPIALGEATKLAGRMLDATKTYDFTIRFGEETNTLDKEGQVTATSTLRPSLAAVEAVLPRFTGEIEQVPPEFSALKIEGKAAYARARAGEHVEMRPRQTFIHGLEVRRETAQGDSSALEELTFCANVAKGTYIRSLGRDIARSLGTVGHLSYLRRTRAGPFALAQAISLDFLAQAAKARALTRMVMPLEAALDDIPALPVTPDQAQLLRYGQKLVGYPARPGLQLAIAEGTPVALVEASTDGLKVVRGFNL